MPDSAPPRGYVFSFDFGLRRIGIAVGQSATRTASVLETVPHRASPDWAAIDRLVAQWKPQLFVVGLPLNMQEVSVNNRLSRWGIGPRIMVSATACASERRSNLANG